jgi:hypothetical protein
MIRQVLGKIQLPAIAFMLLSLTSIAQQEFKPNYDEALVGKFDLPPLLVTASGAKITSLQQWKNHRRQEILNLFVQNVYGKLPPATATMRFEVKSIDSTAYNAKAVRKIITIYLTNDSQGPTIDMLLYLPKHVQRSPVFIGLNFYGNHTITADKEVPLTDRWVANNESYHIRENKAVEASRGAQASRWPVEEILSNGFGVATAYYGDLEPDHPEGWKDGIRSALEKELKVKPREWAAIGAWAWGMSRMMDYLETDSNIDAKKVILTGHSRLGKAALWAAANDTRFAMVVSNNSGEGGAALARRNFGETVERINTAFPHWFIDAYKKYNSDPSDLPVDQHMLLALMAPRPLYVTSASEDQWADPKGEFLSLQYADEVYRLYGIPGLNTTAMPGPDQPVGKTNRYHIRTGKHDITLYDWKQFIRWARSIAQTGN